MSLLASWHLGGVRTGFENEGYYYDDYGYYEEYDHHSSEYIGDLDSLLIVNSVSSGVSILTGSSVGFIRMQPHRHRFPMGIGLDDDIEADKDRRTFNINSRGFALAVQPLWGLG